MILNQNVIYISIYLQVFTATGRVVSSFILQYQYVVGLLRCFGSAEDGTGRQFVHFLIVFKLDKS